MKSKIKSIILKLYGEDVFTRLRTFYWVTKLRKGNFHYGAGVNLLPRFISSGAVCLDIGANFGQDTYLLSKLVGPSGKVFSFEPLDYNFKILTKVIKKLKLTNVEALNVALSDESGEAECIVPIDNFGNPDILNQRGLAHLCSKGEGGGRKEKVKVTTLDCLRSSLPLLNKVILIKCDVEGAELLVFKGAKNLLSRYHPVIFCEIEEKYSKRYGYNTKEELNFFKNLGYKAFISVSDNLVPVQKVYGSIIDYIFIHESLISRYVL